MKEDQSFVKGQRIYSTWRKKFYLVTIVERGRIRVLLENTSNLRYWVAMGRARKIFIPAEEAAEQKMHPTNGGLSASDSLSTPATISG